MKLNRLFLGLASACLLSMPLLAQAHPLAIANNTDSPLSFSVNNVCSEEIGTVYEKEIKTISEETLNKICANFASPCEIMANDAKNCMGKAVGGMKYYDQHSFEVYSEDANRNISISASESSLIYTSSISH